MDDSEMLDTLRDELRAIRPALQSDMPVTSNYKADLLLDSLDLVELIARIEQRFGLTIPDADLPEFISLEATLSYIRARRQP